MADHSWYGTAQYRYGQRYEYAMFHISPSVQTRVRIIESRERNLLTLVLLTQRWAVDGEGIAQVHILGKEWEKYGILKVLCSLPR